MNIFKNAECSTIQRMSAIELEETKLIAAFIRCIFKFIERFHLSHKSNLLLLVNCHLFVACSYHKPTPISDRRQTAVGITLYNETILAKLIVKTRL